MKKPKTNRKQTFYSKDKKEHEIIRDLRKVYRKLNHQLSFNEWILCYNLTESRASLIDEPF
jgi:hypothetical protein